MKNIISTQIVATLAGGIVIEGDVVLHEKLIAEVMEINHSNQEVAREILDQSVENMIEILSKVGNNLDTVSIKRNGTDVMINPSKILCVEVRVVRE